MKPKSKSEKWLVHWFAWTVAIFGVACLLDELTDGASSSRLVGRHGVFKHSMTSHLGGEYWQIASSLNRGEGFSNPFPMPTGPTAWMPPALVYVEAGLLQVFGDRRAHVGPLVMLLKSVTIALTCAAVCVMAQSRRQLTLAIVAISIVLLTNLYWVFQITHDAWLIMGATAAIFWLHRSMERLNTKPWLAGWGAMGGLMALISPGVGFCWAAVMLFGGRFSRREIALAALVSILTVTPWVIRCHYALGRFVPIKSNAGFELWLSNVTDDDGLLDETTLHKHHPFLNAGEDMAKFVGQGEIAVIDSRKKEAFAWIAKHPRDYLQKCGNRLVAMLIWYQPFDPSDRIQPLKLMVKRIGHLLPAIACLGLVLTSRGRRNPDVRLLLLIYGSFLLPYVLVSYYDRYGAGLVPIKVLALF